MFIEKAAVLREIAAFLFDVERFTVCSQWRHFCTNVQSGNYTLVKH